MAAGNDVSDGDFDWEPFLCLSLKAICLQVDEQYSFPERGGKDFPQMEQVWLRIALVV